MFGRKKSVDNDEFKRHLTKQTIKKRHDLIDVNYREKKHAKAISFYKDKEPDTIPNNDTDTPPSMGSLF